MWNLLSSQMSDFKSRLVAYPLFCARTLAEKRLLGISLKKYEVMASTEQLHRILTFFVLSQGKKCTKKCWKIGQNYGLELRVSKGLTDFLLLLNISLFETIWKQFLSGWQPWNSKFKSKYVKFVIVHSTWNIVCGGYRILISKN